MHTIEEKKTTTRENNERSAQEKETHEKKPAIIFRRFQFLLCAVNYDVGEYNKTKQNKKTADSPNRNETINK